MFWEKLVGVRGFEPPAPASRRRCSTRLSYTPTAAAFIDPQGGNRKRRRRLRAFIIWGLSWELVGALDREFGGFGQSGFVFTVREDRQRIQSLAAVFAGAFDGCQQGA